MARRSSLYAAWAQAGREAERQRQAQQRAQAQAIRAREQAIKSAERARVASERDMKRLHVEAREEETEALEAELASRIDGLESILKATLAVDDYIDLDTLKQQPAIPPFNPGQLAQPAQPPQQWAYHVPPLTFAQKLVPGAKERHEKALAEARLRFEHDTTAWQAYEVGRNAQLAAAREAYDREVSEINAKTAAQHAEIDAMKADLARSDPDTIRSYFEMVLSSSSWPDGFPQRFALAYDPQSKLMAIDYELPDFSIVPAEKSYRYVKARDAIDPVAETAARRKALYASAIAQSAIRIVHEVFEADRRGQVESIVLNCVVDTVDRSTG